MSPNYLNAGDWSLAHELGHYFSLPHTEAIDGVWDPEKTMFAPRSKSWDLVYAPGTSAGNPHQWFTSRAAASTYEASVPPLPALQPIQSTLSLCAPPACGCQNDLPTNTLGCNVGVSGG
jgi:hypothetical protein